MTIQTTTPLDERIFEATIGTLELFSIHIGRSLGLYDALRIPQTVRSLAATAGIDRRYAREWLEQQAVAGLVTVEDASAPWDSRSFSLDDVQLAALVVGDDPTHVSPFADMVVGVGSVLGAVVAAYQSGDGVPYSDYGLSFREGQGAINRPAYVHDLTASWLEAVPEVTARLASGGRIADLGCGTGASTIALAKAFPTAEVIGFDSDPASIDDARRHADEVGLEVRFECVDAAELAAHGPFDLVLILEALHDMAQPVAVLSQVRRSLASDGALLVADEKVAEQYTAPGDELERMMYGWSVVHCLPAAMAEQPSAAIGTVLRPDLVRTMAADAGFTSLDVSDIDAGFFNLYVARAETGTTNGSSPIAIW